VGSLATLLFRYPASLLKTAAAGAKLTGPFSKYYEDLDIKDTFLKNYLNLLCFLLQGLPAEGKVFEIRQTFPSNKHSN
jgi:hypothetical protein